MRKQVMYGTQGGGTAQYDEHGVLRFATAPASGTGLKVGDVVPDEWGLQVIDSQTPTITDAFDRAEDLASSRAEAARRQVDEWLSGRTGALADVLEEELSDPLSSGYDDLVHGGNYEHG